MAHQQLSLSCLSAARQGTAAAGSLRQMLEGRRHISIEQMDMRGSMMVENAASLIEGLSPRDVVLASETESRRKLLTAAGIAFRIVEPDVERGGDP